jgi:hypothetical protein
LIGESSKPRFVLGGTRTVEIEARERLRGRLTRRGVALTAGALLGTLASKASAAPPALADSTVGAAMRFAAVGASTAGMVPASVEALVREVHRSFFMTRLKIATAILATLGVTSTGVGVLAFEPGNSPGTEGRSSARPGLGPSEVKARPEGEGRIEADELEEHRAKEKAAVEREEHRAKEKAAVERLHKAVDRASREQLIKAILAAGPDERLLRILEGEDREEHRAKEKELIEHRAKEKELIEHKAKEKAPEGREG